MIMHRSIFLNPFPLQDPKPSNFPTKKTNQNLGYLWAKFEAHCTKSKEKGQ